MNGWHADPNIVNYFRLRWPGLSSRALNILALNDIVSVEQLAATSELTLRKYRNCGRKTVNELRSFLQMDGLDLMHPIESKIKRLENEIRELKMELVRKERRIKELEQQ